MTLKLKHLHKRKRKARDDGRAFLRLRNVAIALGVICFMYSMISLSTDQWGYNPLEGSSLIPSTTSLSSTSSSSTAATATTALSSSGGRMMDAISKPSITTLPSSELRTELATNGYAELVWEKLLLAGSSAESLDQQNANDIGMAVVEVGMHQAKQCLQAATIGFQAHCVEPSPTSFQRIEGMVNYQKSIDPYLRNRVHLYNVAAGSEESVVPFVASGGTGDHVGEVDMWKMEKIESTDGNNQRDVIQVPSKPLDSILRTIPETIYLLKVDTQGFEPHVFSGLDQMLSKHKIQYILTEYWPKGMDILAGKMNRECVGVTHVLQKMIQYGYTLYALPAHGHPRAPAYKELPTLQRFRPYNDLMSNCQWYYELEDRFSSEEYKMGYWTDILALAPSVELPDRLRNLPQFV